MDESHKKAQATRERNLAAQAALSEERVSSKRAARLALQRVTENPDAPCRADTLDQDTGNGAGMAVRLSRSFPAPGGISPLSWSGTTAVGLAG